MLKPLNSVTSEEVINMITANNVWKCGYRLNFGMKEKGMTIKLKAT